MPKQINNLDYEEYKRKLLENSERDDLSELQQKYANVDEPDYDNMNLHDELQTRMDLQKMNELQQKYPSQYAQNNLAGVMSDATVDTEVAQPPVYIFSQDMRNRLGLKESSNNYSAENDFGALGKYQLTPKALEDIKYYTPNHKWTGKNNIYSKKDFFNAHQFQEDALDEYLKKQNYYLNYVKAYDFVGLPIRGLKADFNISKTGLLAAAHRAGYRTVKNYLNALEKNPQGMYYMNYDKLSPRDDEWFRFVERRLREFEK